MRGAYVATVAIGLMVTAAALPSVAAVNQDDGVFDGLSIQEYTVEKVRDEYGELPDTVEVRVNGGPVQTVPTDEALGMMLETADESKAQVQVPGAPRLVLPTHAASAGTGPTPTVCHPAQIVSVFAFGDWGAEVEAEGEDNGGAACFGIPQLGPVASAEVDITNGGFVEAALTNSLGSAWAPGFHCGAGAATGHCGDWDTSGLRTINCVVVIEFAFFGLFIQQVGAGMPGCGINGANPTATQALEN